MNLAKLLKQLTQNPAWSFVGFVLAIFFGGIAIYVEFYRGLGSAPRFEIVSSASVFDVHEPIADLRFVYDGVDLAESEQTLKLIVVRLVNRGSGVILNSHYDARAPLTLTIGGAELVRPELLAASSDYLLKFAKFEQRGRYIIEFQPVILEPEEWLSVKLLVLTRGDSRVRFDGGGKVAGVQEVPVLDLTAEGIGLDLWTIVLGGSPWIQAIRLVVYPLSAVVFLVLLLGFGQFVRAIIGRESRRRHTRRIARDLAPELQWIVRGYIREGLHFVRELYEVGGQPELINSAFEAGSGASEKLHGVLLRPGIHRARAPDEWIAMLQRRGFLVANGGEWKVDREQHDLAHKLWVVGKRKSKELREVTRVR